MTREELLKMSKKDLKNRLAELGKNAQTLSGQELTDAMDEARAIGEILDEIKGREELEAAAKAAGAADPDEGDGAGEGSEEPQDQERAKRGKTLKDGKKAFFKGKALAGIKNTLTTATGVVMPKHTSPDISPTFNNVSSLIDRVKTVPLVGGESYQRPFVKSYGDGAGSTAENADYNTSEPEFGYSDIVREKITAYAEEPEEMQKLTDADYDGVVEESVTRAIKRYASRQILVGPGGTGKFRGIFFNPAKAADDIIDRNTDITTITAIADDTLDEIIYSFGGDEDVEDIAVLILNKKDLKKFAKLRDKQGRKVYTIKVVCTSDKNVSLTFTWDDFTPFHLVDIEGIYGIESNVVTSENTTTDGSTYQGATAKERNIVITVEMDSNYKENRNLLYRTFPIKRTGTMQYIEDGEAKAIEYEVESVIPGATTGVVRDYTISLKCTDPYFKDLADIEVVMASWVSDFYFPACFPEEGRIFGHREADLVKEIENESGADNIGIVVIFRADGAVKNPAIYHTESGEFTKVGYSDNDFIMSSGQYVIINTYTGKKNAYLLDGVTQAEIENHKDNYGVIDWDTVIEKYGTVINEYLDEDGEFIQLQDGTNTLTYTADEGTNYLSVSVYYRISYLGV